MEIKDLLTYLAALFLPLWLGAEQILSWWALRQGPAQAGPEQVPGGDAGKAANETPQPFTRKAA